MHSGPGAYCDGGNVPAEKLVPFPGDISDEAAATLFFWDDRLISFAQDT